MALEQLWSFEYISGLGSESGGVVVLDNGKLLGGDNNYFYIGSYELVNTTFNATIDVKHYHGGYNSLFGKNNEIILELSGSYKHEEILLTGYILEDISENISVKLTYHKELF